MMREQKAGATFVERLLGGERRRPYQRDRGAGKLKDHRAANNMLNFSAKLIRREGPSWASNIFYYNIELKLVNLI